jgi:hypothetical protein
VKCDALDHASGHDLVGPQDPQWDVAGASVELGLDEAAELELGRRVDHALGRKLAPEVRRFHRVAYLAFQLASADAARAASLDEHDKTRAHRAFLRYGRDLERTLEG